MVRVITLFEYESSDKYDIRLTKKQLQCLEALQKDIKPILDVHHGYFKATSFVGIIQLPGLTIEILPKLFKGETEDKIQAITNLLHLLQYTRRLFRNIRESELSGLRRKKTNFFEVLIYLYASHLIELLKKGIYRTYLAFEGDSRFLKGSWMLSEQIGRRPHLQEGFLIRHDDFTEDIPLNQLFKYVAGRLRFMSHDDENKRLLNQVILILADVEDVKRISVDGLASIHFTRLNDEYKPVFKLASLFLSSLSIQLSSGEAETYAFVFDMNVLFEEFLVEFLKQEHVLTGTQYEDCAILAQSGIRYLVRQGQTEVYKLKPDIRLGGGDHTRCIIDTKYKMLVSGKLQYGISQSDMNQMYVYAKRYRCDRVILLYPRHNCFQTLVKSYHTEEQERIEVHTIDIRPDVSKPSERRVIKEELRQILSTA